MSEVGREGDQNKDFNDHFCDHFCDHFLVHVMYCYAAFLGPAIITVFEFSILISDSVNHISVNHISIQQKLMLISKLLTYWIGI